MPHTQVNNLRYSGARFSYGASENSVSVLDPHGEQSLGVSSMWMLRKTGEGGVKLALGARGVAYHNVKSNVRPCLNRQ